MAQYVDGFVLPVPKKNIAAYQRMAQKAGKVWREHGALEFRECVGDDLEVKFGVPFPRGIKVKPGETVVFSYIVFKSRAHRDKINAKVMKDPRMAESMDVKSMPFDCKRMLYGGFKVPGRGLSLHRKFVANLLMTAIDDMSAERTADREILSTRVLNAPRELVFAAWEDPKHLARWWGPKECTNTFQEFELKPGGHWRFVMHGPDGVDYQNESVFDEVVKPERIVFRHLDPVHKFQMTVTFADLSGKTRLTWRMLHETTEKCEAVKPFVIEANEQNFDRLEAELETIRSA